MTLKDGNLDELEEEIISALQEDARKSFKSIAADLGVSEGTISNRVNRLIQKGILKLEARVNPFKLTHKVAALLGVNLKRRSHEETIREIEKMPYVNAVWVTTGQYDIFVEVLADSINDLNDFLFGGAMSHIENIHSTETYVMLHSDTKFFKIK